MIVRLFREVDNPTTSWTLDDQGLLWFRSEDEPERRSNYQDVYELMSEMGDAVEEINPAMMVVEGL